MRQLNYFSLRKSAQIKLCALYPIMILAILVGCASHPTQSPVNETESLKSPEATQTPTFTDLVNPGSRPIALVRDLDPSSLATTLLSCESGPFQRTKFSIAHRGAPLGFPEHTREGYQAAARMGAGVIECDVTFTKDKHLVCRHSQCDLHTTTNILQTKLSNNCTIPFAPATDNSPATARCCTSDITLGQFKQLCGRRDIVNKQATTIDEYLTAPISEWVDVPVLCGTLMTHPESIKLIDTLGADFAPELKAPMVQMPFNNFSQSQYASKMLNQYHQANINPQRVYPQSFRLEDVLYWIEQHPEFGSQAVYLDPRGRAADFKANLTDMQQLYQAGVRIIAPPIPMLIKLDEQGKLVATDYARYAKQAGLEIITWTFESGHATDPNNWLYGSINGYMAKEANMLNVLDMLATKVGIRGIFSDWPGTVTYYDNCLNR